MPGPALSCPLGVARRLCQDKEPDGLRARVETWVCPSSSGSHGAGAETAQGEPRPARFTDPAPWHPGRPPCSASRLSVLRKDRWRHQLLHGEVRQGPPALPRPAGGSLCHWDRPAATFGEPPKPCADLQGRRPWALGRAWQGLVPWARPSEEGGRGPRPVSRPHSPRGSESHARTGRPLNALLNPGPGCSGRSPSGACLGGI